jgi:L-fuconolactonase
MVTEADWENWKPRDLRPYIETALELFGPQRLMYGSDWPVCELAGSYGEVHAALAEALALLSNAERDAIWGQTAASFYRLPPEEASTKKS